MEETLQNPLLGFGQPAVIRRAPRLRWLLFVCVGVLGLSALVGAGSLIVRSEWFLRSRIDPKLESLGAKLHGELTYERVSPVGLTGVMLEGVHFEPDQDLDLASPFSIERLIVYPDLAAMLTGDLQPHALELHDVHAEFWLDGGATGRGHWPWLERVVDEWSASPPSARRGGGGSGGKSPLPEIRVFGGQVEVKSPEGTMPHMGMSVDSLVVRMVDDQLELDGAINVDGLGYALLSGDASRQAKRAGVVVELADAPDLLSLAPQRDLIREVVGENSRLELGGVAVQWPPAIIVQQVRLTDTHIGVPGHDTAFIEQVGAGEIALRFKDQKALIEVSDFDASVRVEWMDRFGTSIPLKLPLFTVVADFEERRIGAGFQLDTGESGKLDFAAALDLTSLDLAVQFAADHFDAGRMLSFIPYTGPVDITRGRLDGHASMRYPLREKLVEVDAFLNISELDISVPWISELPMTDVDLTFDVKTLLDLDQRQLSIRDGMMSLGELMFSISGLVRQTGDGRNVYIEASVAGEDLVADDALSSLPKGFAPALEGYELAGNFSVAMRLKLDTRHPEEMELEHELDLSNLRVLVHGPRADIPLLATEDFAIRVRTATDETVISPRDVDWTPFYRVPKYFPMSLITAEDARFFSHNGFDARAIHSSIIANLSAHRIVRGGSTISQQVVKNLFLSQKKTVARKVQEAFLTWQLENHLEKQRIIELYMNLAHWGPNIYGIKEAAFYYFRKRPSRLTIEESLFLASILPSPVRFGRHYAEGFIREDRLTKMKNGLFALYRKGFMDSKGYEAHLHNLNRANVSDEPRPSLPESGTPATTPEPEIEADEKTAEL
ncbi:MAG: hypothetical protein COW42_05065 [Deltaproteobacteria bacterium CG17_big_fil_post_rev_8_21_14_2_50_63_7]|nr:MAG: hypothetical protein COW42_05065 [Deltaproteobacteria bacterium CG17_big_fil_post_rev_8_21_14_2_50_63_7]